MKKTTIALSFLFCFTSIAQLAMAESAPQRGVMYGDDEEELDACTGLGKTKAGAVFHQFINGKIVSENLPAGQTVHVCEQSGGYEGIVIGENCGVNTPINPKQLYKGPCKSGWLLSQFMDFIAG